MDATTVQPIGALEADSVLHLVEGLEKYAGWLGNDFASRNVREGVKALRAAIGGSSGTVAAALQALDVTIDRLHMSHMRPLFRQTLRTLRTALDMDISYAQKTSALDTEETTWHR
jgi:hypothetical protein